MATITPTVTRIGGDDSGIKIAWETLTTTNDNGSPAEWFQWSDRTVQITGTFGSGGTCKIQGSNDGSNWYDLTDPQGNAISKTSAGIETCTELTQYVRPYISAGDGTTDIDVTLVMRRATPMRT